MTISRANVAIISACKITGTKVELVYVLRAGTNEIAVQSERFERPLLVRPGEAYDVMLKQPAGSTKLGTGITAKAGELKAVP